MYGYIYLTTNLINGKKYIGLHRSDKFDESYKGSGSIFKKAIEKYGWDNFKCEIIEECDNDEELNNREEYWIAFYNAVESDEYYNIARGGNNMEKTPEYRAALKKAWTDERRKKQSLLFKTDANPNRSPEARRKMSEHNSSKRPEIRKRLSEKAKGRHNPHTPEWNEKIGNALRGRKDGPLSDETKAKISLKKSGKNNPMYGKSATRGTKWFTDGKINVRRAECPEGFYPGVTMVIAGE